MFIKSVIEIVPSSTKSLKKIKSLMKKYADLPMDFADASIVCLASEAGMQNIVTLEKKILPSTGYRKRKASR
jgi:hypothetical protein